MLCSMYLLIGAPASPTAAVSIACPAVPVVVHAMLALTMRDSPFTKSLSAGPLGG